MVDKMSDLSREDTVCYCTFVVPFERKIQKAIPCIQYSGSREQEAEHTVDRTVFERQTVQM
jgi:hypothetical protein